MKIRKIRLTWMTTHMVPIPFADAHFEDIEELAAAWLDPRSLHLAGLQWHHPWFDANAGPVGPDRAYWARVVELRRITDEVNASFRDRLLRYAVPLRASSAVDVDPSESRISSAFAEVFILPWSATGAVTATLTFPGSVRLDDATDVTEVIRTSAVLDNEHLPGVVSPVDLSRRLAQMVTMSITNAHQISEEEIGPSTLATVIDADLPDPLVDMSTDAQFCYSMHRLAGTAAPGLPFEWIRVLSVGGPGCLTGELRRVLTSGMSQWSQGALVSTPADPLDQTGGIHRNAVLSWATYTALHGLLDASWPRTDPQWFLNLRDDHRRLFGRYYGPSAKHQDWIGQAYVDVNSIGDLLGTPVAKVPWRCP